MVLISTLKAGYLHLKFFMTMQRNKWLLKRMK